MTAKEQLLEYVQGLTEEEAIDALPFIVPPGPSFPPAPPEVMDLLRRAQEERRLGGKGHTTEEVRRSVGLG